MRGAKAAGLLLERKNPPLLEELEKICKEHEKNAFRLSDEIRSLEEKNLELKAIVKQVRCKATKSETKVQKLQLELDAAQKRVSGANFKAAAAKLVDGLFGGAKILFANHR